MSIPKKIVEEGGGGGAVNKKQPVVRTLGESLKKYFAGLGESSYLAITKNSGLNSDQKSDQVKEI